MRVAGQRHRERQRPSRMPGWRPCDREALLEAERPVRIPLAETRAPIDDAVGLHARCDRRRARSASCRSPRRASSTPRASPRAERHPRAVKAQAETLRGARRRKPALRGADPVGRAIGTQRCETGPCAVKGRLKSPLCEKPPGRTAGATEERSPARPSKSAAPSASDSSAAATSARHGTTALARSAIGSLTESLGAVCRALAGQGFRAPLWSRVTSAAESAREG